MNKNTIFGRGNPDVEESAVVVSIEDGITKVKLEKNATCENCGTSNFCHPETGNRPSIEVQNDIGAEVGDIINIEVAPSSRIVSSLIVFGVPIIGLAAGAALGGMMGNASQDSAVVGSIAGLAFGLLIVGGVNRIFKNSKSIRPRASRIVLKGQ